MWGRTVPDCFLFSFLLVFALFGATFSSRPHIIMIMADDLGWNDVSFHGSNQFMTPNIDALAYSGVILQNFYTQPLCTPARAALLTGRHPIHTGMQHGVIFAPQPWGLPLTERLLPQYLQEVGYRTHGVGKWHLGFSRSEYTPTYRGFDSFFGSWTGHQDHFTHMAYHRHPGYDLHRNMHAADVGHRNYSTSLFSEEAESIIHHHDSADPLFLYLSYTAPHAPIQAPREAVRELKHIKHHRRRKYAAMVTTIDESVGRVVLALKRSNMLNNSIIVFMTDNGGATHNYNGNVASNWPLRGGKDTLWDGGVRGVALIWSPLLKTSRTVHKGVFLMEDWLPTLLRTAGYKEKLKHIDGRNQWRALNNEEKSPHVKFIHNSDYKRRIKAFRWGKWKIIKGRTHRGHYDGWFGYEHTHRRYDVDSVRVSDVSHALSATLRPVPPEHVMENLRYEATVRCNVSAEDRAHYKCHPKHSTCLFNLENDPCEMVNLAKMHPDITLKMKQTLDQYRPVPPGNQRADPRSYPKHWNHTWVNWQDYVH